MQMHSWKIINFIVFNDVYSFIDTLNLKLFIVVILIFIVYKSENIVIWQKNYKRISTFIIHELFWNLYIASIIIHVNLFRASFIHDIFFND